MIGNAYFDASYCLQNYKFREWKVLLWLPQDKEPVRQLSWVGQVPTKEILFIYSDAVSAFGKEAELVGAFRNDPLCMNLRQGGSGGFDWINQNLASLLGKKFGRLTVIAFSGSKKEQRFWTVQCDCGIVKLVSTAAMRSGKTRGCGYCLKRDDLTGQKFSHLTVLAFSKVKNGECSWLCRCDCGVEKCVKAKSLKNGDAKSCGCFHPKRPKIGFGQNFGRLTVISRVENSFDQRSRWLVKCTCGNEKPVSGYALTSGATQSCGCLRKETTAKLKAKTMRHGQ